MEARSGLTDLVCALKHALSVAIPGSILTFTTDGDAKDFADGYDFAALSECLDFMVCLPNAFRHQQNFSSDTSSLLIDAHDI